LEKVFNFFFVAENFSHRLKSLTQELETEEIMEVQQPTAPNPWAEGVMETSMDGNPADGVLPAHTQEARQPTEEELRVGAGFLTALMFAHLNNMNQSNSAPQSSDAAQQINTAAKQVKAQHPTEFHRAYEFGIETAGKIAISYPLVTLVTTVVLTLLGISNFFSLNLFTGIVLIGIAAIFILGMKKESTEYGKALTDSFWEIKDWFVQSVKNSAESQPVASAAQIAVNREAEAVRLEPAGQTDQ